VVREGAKPHSPPFLIRGEAKESSEMGYPFEKTGHVHDGCNFSVVFSSSIYYF